MKVYVFSSIIVYDSDVIDDRTKVFCSREEALKALDDFKKKEQSYIEKEGWTIYADDEDFFEACEEGRYCENHSLASFKEFNLNAAKKYVFVSCQVIPQNMYFEDLTDKQVYYLSKSYPDMVRVYNSIDDILYDFNSQELPSDNDYYVRAMDFSEFE